MNLSLKYPLAVALLTLLASGCASSNVNAHKADADAGYVDFYTDANLGLAWDVQEASADGGDFETLFSDVTPAAGNVLRLPFVPGRHQLRVTLLNRVVAKPVNMDVVVESGKVTPVRIFLTEAGSTVVVSKKTIMGGTGSRSGRQTDTQRDESTMYELSAIASPSLPLQTPEQMAYTH
jgi:hypothetical protein